MLHITPFAFFTLRGPLTSMDASLEEAAYASGANPWQVACRVTMPLMIFPLLSSLLLCFVLSVEQFAIPAMVGIPGHVNTLATELYLLTSFSPPNTGSRRRGRPGDERGHRPVDLPPAPRRAPPQCAHRHRPRLSRAHAAARPLARAREVLCLFYVLMSFIIPTLALIYTSGIKFFVANPFEAAWTWRNYHQIWESPGTVRAL